MTPRLGQINNLPSAVFELSGSSDMQRTCRHVLVTLYMILPAFPYITTASYGYTLKEQVVTLKATEAA
ncbi:hypothetical protein SAMN06298226_3066 [Nitrosovibrio sp. Nv4]|nr:hypothetical protein SAMN06298226_3066 [Nitrosovibrio sp. Nv4]